MNINKFVGKTKEEAIEKAKQEMGEDVAIMSAKPIKQKGLFGLFGGSAYEVTAARKEEEHEAGSSVSLGRKFHDINLAADEKIELPKPTRVGEESPKTSLPPIRSEAFKKAVETKILPAEDAYYKENPIKTTAQLNREQEAKQARVKQPTTASSKEEAELDQRLDALSKQFDQKLGDKEEESKTKSTEELNFVRLLYRTLLNNEVNETYVNQIIDETEQFIRPGNSIDMILSNVYQKLILRFGRPAPIELGKSKPKVVFFIGPTGVGKTTTIAKVASKFKVEEQKRVAFITADTYRIAATEQLRVYANILNAPMTIVYSKEELDAAVEEMADFDMIFVDTAGFSHKNENQKQDTKALLTQSDLLYDKEVFLVLSATTKYKDLLEIVDMYKEISPFRLIFTKLDETSAYGNLLNIKLYSGAELSYVTTGQNVPADIEVFDSQKIVKQLLGGR